MISYEKIWSTSWSTWTRGWPKHGGRWQSRPRWEQQLENRGWKSSLLREPVNKAQDGSPLGNLVDETAHETAGDISNEEGAGDPGADVEVNLDGVAGDRAVHHLGNGDAGERHPAPHAHCPKRHADCRQKLEDGNTLNLKSYSEIFPIHTKL